jgi:hypothetical protein
MSEQMKAENFLAYHDALLFRYLQENPAQEINVTAVPT